MYQSWCPPPGGYPRHCCYAQALGIDMDAPDHAGAAAAKAAAKRRRNRPPGAFLLQVYPERPVFQQPDAEREEEEI